MTRSEAAPIDAERAADVHELPEGDSVRQGTVSTALAQIVTVVSSTFVGSIVSHALGPAGKGAVTAIRTLFQMLLQFGGLGIVRASHVVLGKGRCSLEAATGTFTLLFLLGMSGAIGAVALLLFVGAPWLERMLSVELSSNPDLAWRQGDYSGHTPLLLLAVLTLIGGLSHVLRGILQGLAKLAWMNLAGIAGALLSLAGLAVLAALGELTIARAIWVLIAVQGLQAILALRWLTALLRERVRIDAALVRHTLSFGFPLWIGEVGRFLFIRVDLLIVGASLGNAELGPYSVGYALMEMAWFFPRALGVASYRRITGADAERGLELTREVTQLSFVTACIGCLLIAALSWPLTRVLYGADFLVAVPIFFLLVPGALARASVSWYETYLQGTLGRPAWDTALQLIGGAMKIAFSLLLVMGLELGVYGVAIGASLANVCFTVLIVAFMTRVTGRGARWLWYPERRAWIVAFDRIERLVLAARRRLAKLRPHGDAGAPALHVLIAEAGDPFAERCAEHLAAEGLRIHQHRLERGSPRALLRSLPSTRPGTVLIAFGPSAGERALRAAQLLPGLRVILVRDEEHAVAPRRLLAEAREQNLLSAASLLLYRDPALAERLERTERLAPQRMRWLSGPEDLVR